MKADPDSRRADALVGGALLLVLGVIAVWNAALYPIIGGYDAAEHLAYSRALNVHGVLPEGGASYTPPGFYVVAGALTDLGIRLSLDESEKLAQYLNALLVVATGVLVLVLGRLLFPRRPLVRWGALAFFVCCPIVLRAAAMFHPQPLALFLSTAALTLCAWMIVRRRYRLHWWLALGLILGTAQLVRSVSLWTVGVVVLAFVWTAFADLESRRAIRNALLVFVALVVLVPLPWYIHLKATTSSAVFGRPSVTGSLLESPWTSEFYFSPGLPDVIGAPQRTELPPRFLPTLYADTWGDYFGNWSWDPPRPELTPAVNRRLTIQSLAGLPLTALALAGWFALAGLAAARRREAPGRVLVVLMPVVALAGVLYYARQAPHPDGDTVKAIFLLPAVPAWALSFGFALDVLAARGRRVALPTALVLVSALLVSLAYATFATVS